MEWVKSTFSNPSGNCIEVRRLECGCVEIRESDRPTAVVRTTEAKYKAFLMGALAGEFDLERVPTAEAGTPHWHSHRCESVRDNTHFCKLDDGHSGDHVCRTCGYEWETLDADRVPL